MVKNDKLLYCRKAVDPIFIHEPVDILKNIPRVKVTGIILT